jgi:hypothetical protein
MKIKAINETVAPRGPGKKFSQLCLSSCRKILAGIQRAKVGILAESAEALGAQERLLGLALNEAEALAWQTAYPHLVFPSLAAEKVQAVADWNRHQEALRQNPPLLALAA